MVSGPKDHIAEIRGFPPEKYAPLWPNRDDLRSVYLTEISSPLGAVLFRLIGSEAKEIADTGQELGQADRASLSLEPTLDEWERRIDSTVQRDP